MAGAMQGTQSKNVWNSHSTLWLVVKCCLSAICEPCYKVFMANIVTGNGGNQADKQKKASKANFIERICVVKRNLGMAHVFVSHCCLKFCWMRLSRSSVFQGNTTGFPIGSQVWSREIVYLLSTIFCEQCIVFQNPAKSFGVDQFEEQTNQVLNYEDCTQ